MTRKKYFKVSVAIGLVLVLALTLITACGGDTTTPTTPTDTSAETFEWKLAAFDPPPPGYFGAAPELEWMEKIEELTDGRITVDDFWGGTLAKGNEFLEGLDTGLCQIAIGSTGFYPDRFAIHELLGFPFVCTDLRDTGMVHWDLLYSGLHDAEWKDQGYTLLSFRPVFAHKYHLTERTGKILKLEDLQNLKMRSSGKAARDANEILGASPVQIASAEVYMSLERNIVDGCTTGIDYAAANNFWEVLAYIMTNDFAGGCRWLATSNEAWDSLPVDIQSIFKDLMQESYYDWLMACEEEHDKSKAALEEGGVEFYTLPDSEWDRWKEALEPAIEERVEELEAKGVPAREVMKRVEAYVH